MRTADTCRLTLLLIVLLLPALAVACTQPPPEGPGSQSGTTPEAAGARTQPAPKPAAGAVVEKQLIRSASAEEIDQASGRFYVHGNARPAQHAVGWYRIRAASTDHQNAPLEILAQVFVPQTAQPTEFPLYVFGPGTTGLGDHCAPSQEQPTDRNWGDFQTHLLSYAAQGYVSVMPDYAGFNDAARPQLYYIHEAHARVMLDAARAARALLQTGAPETQARAADAVFFAGYSQGGHAALAARDAAARYAPELRVRGAIAYGGRGDVATLFTEFPALGPLLLYVYRHVYGADTVDLERLLLPRWLPTLEADVTGKCIDQFPGYYGDDPRQIYRAEFVDALRQNRLGEVFPALHGLLARNAAGQSGPQIPVLVLQGLADTVVDPGTQQAFVRRVCGAGGRATLLTYPGVPHTLTRQVSYPDTLDWMAGLVRSEASRTDCPAH